MRLTSIAILRHNGPGAPKPIILDNAHDLSEFGFFQRGGVKEMLVFFSRTIVEGVAVGLSVVDHEGYQCFCVRQGDGLCGIAFGDKEYPSRVGFEMLRKTLESFNRAHSATWKTVSVDNGCPFPELAATLAEYQSPEKVDTIMKIHTSLAETKDVLHQSIDAVLERGVKLDDLVKRSEDLSSRSKLFYDQAKKTNSSCCVIC